MNRTEYIGKLNALYVGDKNCLEELITAYDEKDKEIERLNNIIKEAKEEIEYFELQAKHLDDNIYLDEKLTNKLLEILEGE